MRPFHLLVHPLSALAMVVCAIVGVAVMMVAFVAGTGPFAAVETVGQARFQAGQVVLTLPAGWRARYDGQQPWQAATVFDERGQPQVAVTVDLWSRAQLGVGGDLLAAYIESRSGAAPGSPDRLIGSPRSGYRTLPRGEVWVSQRVYQQPAAPFTLPGGQVARDRLAGRATPTEIMHRIAQVQYAERWQGGVLAYTFQMVAEQQEVLEPLTWRWVQGSMLRGANGDDPAADAPASPSGAVALGHADQASASKRIVWAPW